MSHYRDNQQAAMARAAALDAQLHQLREEKSHDQARIHALEGELHKLRQQMASMPLQFQSPAPISSSAGTVLVFGILSIVFCQILGPFAWYYGGQEIERIEDGLSDPRRRGEAVAGKVLGIIGTIILALEGLIFMGGILSAII